MKLDLHIFKFAPMSSSMGYFFFFSIKRLSLSKLNWAMSMIYIGFVSQVFLPSVLKDKWLCWQRFHILTDKDLVRKQLTYFYEYSVLGDLFQMRVSRRMKWEPFGICSIHIEEWICKVGGFQKNWEWEIVSDKQLCVFG